MQDIFNTSKWCTSPTAYWTIQYEYRRNGVDMQYRFYWKVWLGYSSGYYNNGLQLQLFLDGSQKNITVKGYGTNKGWSYNGTTDWYTVLNKTSGTTPFYVKLYDTSASTTEATSSTYSLAVSPSGATLTSAPDFTDEDNPTIYYTNPNGDNVTSLQACISWTGGADIGYRDISKSGTSYTFNLTDDEKKRLRKAASGSNSLPVTFYVTTVLGGSTFYSTITKTLSIVNANPTFTEDQITYADTSDVVDITNDPLCIVQNKSNLSVTFGNATANKEATISWYEITVNGILQTASEGCTLDFGKINASSNCEISIKVTDSRGNTATAKKVVTVYPYIEPVIAPHSNYGSIICERCDEDGNLDKKGRFLKVIVKGQWYALPNESNSASVDVKYATTDYESDWIPISVSEPIKGGGAENNYLSWYDINKVAAGVTLDTKKTYKVTIRCIDSFQFAPDIPFKISTADTCFHLGKYGNKAAFGKYAEIDNALEIKPEWELYVKGMTLSDYIKETINNT